LNSWFARVSEYLQKNGRAVSPVFQLSSKNILSYYPSFSPISGFSC
jgi:hypothetical protein